MKIVNKGMLVIRVILLVGIFILSQPLLSPNLKDTARASEVAKPLNQEPLPRKSYLPLVSLSVPAEESWPMVAANPQRTSWTPTQVTGPLHVEWYRPIEAYISQNVQVIASNGLLYISSPGAAALNTVQALSCL
jgi:hypothetical protein